jgi:hypothetical protein
MGFSWISCVNYRRHQILWLSGCRYRIVCFKVEEHCDDRGGGLVVDGALEHDDAFFQQAGEDIVAA